MARHGKEDIKPESVAEAVTEMKLERNPSTESVSVNGFSNNTPVKAEEAEEQAHTNGAVSKPSSRSTPINSSPASQRSQSPALKNDDEQEEEKVGGDITVKVEPGQPPKLTRSSSQKIVPKPAPLYDHLPDNTAEATSTFQVMEACTYSNKNLGYTDHAMDCDCTEEWDNSTATNVACGEDSDCINRATKMECVGNCGCGDNCQNQRYQRRQYANVTVIKTDKKGYGLRADSALRPHEFIFEYIGEVINEPQFRRRMIQYDEDGIKHFYFMSLNKGEFVDATKKGNLGRFCNHSCNPNCYVDKWVVGEKLRMGIFAERHIKAGEELVFNYNVDRYGADPQPCYCGEPNCMGYIGGKTQTERATKLSNATIEALGIDDLDSWDTAVAKRPRKKKTEEDDEEYVESFELRSLDEDSVTKVMAALMQCKEKWIAVKLLGRIQRCEDERVRNRVVKMHGYQILKTQLTTWKDDFNVVLQILNILDGFPRLTRNKILDSKIEDTIKPLTECGDERVEKKATALLEVWSTLEVGYRIPRMKRDPAAMVNNGTPSGKQFGREAREERGRKSRSKSRSRSRSRSVDVTRVAPRGPAAHNRNGKGHRNSYHPGPRPFRRQFNPLPAGWFAAESNGKTYYYSARGDTTWVRPTAPAPQPPPPPKPESKNKTLQDIIDGIMNAKEDTPKGKDTSATPATPADAKVPEKKEPKEKWRSYGEDKRKRLYENTLFPHVKYVMDKFKHKLPREDLKRYAKEVGKKLVNSDFKNNRVADPTKISDKQIKQVKKYCKEYFDKAVSKHRAYDQKKQERKSKESHQRRSSTSTDRIDKKEHSHADRGVKKEEDSDADVDLSDDDDMAGFKVSSSPREGSSAAEPLKRKRSPADDDDDDRQEDTADAAADEPNHSPKRQKSTSPQHLPPPPPPPPPMSLGDASPNDISDMSLKRKRPDEEGDYANGAGSMSPGKRHRSEETPPPPPPPPPGLPADIMDTNNSQDDIDDHRPSGEPQNHKGDGSSIIRERMDLDSSGDVPKDFYQNGNLQGDSVSKSQPLSPLHNNISPEHRED